MRGLLWEKDLTSRGRSQGSERLSGEAEGSEACLASWSGGRAHPPAVLSRKGLEKPTGSSFLCAFAAELLEVTQGYCGPAGRRDGHGAKVREDEQEPAGHLCV